MKYFSNFWKCAYSNKTIRAVSAIGGGLCSLLGGSCTSLPSAENEAARIFFGDNRPILEFYHHDVMSARVNSTSDIVVSAPYMVVSNIEPPDADYFFSRIGYAPNGSIVYRTDMPAFKKFDPELGWVIQDVNGNYFNPGSFGNGITENELNAVVKNDYVSLLSTKSKAIHQSILRGGNIGDDIGLIARNSWPYQDSSYFYVNGRAVPFSEVMKMIEGRNGKISINYLKELMRNEDKK